MNSGLALCSWNFEVFIEVYGLVIPCFLSGMVPTVLQGLILTFLEE